MTTEQKEKMQNEMTNFLKSKHSDTRTHVDRFYQKGTLNISFF